MYHRWAQSGTHSLTAPAKDQGLGLAPRATWVPKPSQIPEEMDAGPSALLHSWVWGGVCPHTWVWRAHWLVLSAACLHCVNLPACCPPQCAERETGQALGADRRQEHGAGRQAKAASGPRLCNFGQVNRLCLVCHPGTAADNDAHRLRGWGWGNERRELCPVPGLHHSCHHCPSTIQRMETKQGGLAVEEAPSAGWGGASPGGHGTGRGGPCLWVEPGCSPSWQPPLPASAQALQDQFGSLDKVAVTGWGAKSASSSRPSQASATSGGRPEPRALPCPQGPGPTGARFGTWPTERSVSLSCRMARWMHPGKVGLNLGNI